MPKNRQEIPKAERQAELVAQARELFIDNGYRGTSVAAVGRAAGIAPAAVHWYFPTKDDLFAAVIAAIFETERAQVEADATTAGDPRAELVALLLRMEPYRALHRVAYERMAETASLRAVYEQMQDWLEQRLFAAVSRRVGDSADLASITDLAHVLFEGLLVSVRRLDRPTDELIELLISALAAAAVSPS
ncbi:TetR/AcrR family transcriptional regulator [Nocardia neocaledoniensis]|uniref:TetR/AcrR family transcriptional regulator n=1 Tax=Nocardia neocaledoniensis TaxID=236511 RepID=UPI002456D8CF|nr:helix-turn-helix domain-containing protein [Nocardia neocaledoniensis]